MNNSYRQNFSRKVLGLFVLTMLLLYLIACGSPLDQSYETPRGSSSSASILVNATELTDEERHRHEQYMTIAIELAKEAPGAPFGAVVVDRTTGDIVCAGANRGREGPVYHGEIVALMNCAKHHPDWNNLTLYTSAEPCPMCASAIAWARIPEIVYATSIKTLTELGVLQIQIDSASVAKAAKDFPLGHGKIVSGVLEEEADILYARWADGFSDTASE